MSLAAVRDKALFALSWLRLVIDPVLEVRLKLLSAVMLLKFLFRISLFAERLTLFPVIDPELVILPDVEVIKHA